MSMVASGRARVEHAQITAALDGDPVALERVISGWLPTVYSWCARLGAGRIDSEEAAHDVMMIFVHRRHTIEGPERLSAWLFGACRRVVANHRRRAWIRRWVPGVLLDNQPAPERADALSEARDLARSIERVLDRLSVAHREVLVLCYLEERSVLEAAELLGVPPGTVKSRLFHARNKFQTLFGRDEP